jgi:hypothetical protein
MSGPSSSIVGETPFLLADFNEARGFARSVTGTSEIRGITTLKTQISRQHNVPRENMAHF